MWKRLHTYHSEYSIDLLNMGETVLNVYTNEQKHATMRIIVYTNIQFYLLFKEIPHAQDISLSKISN